MFDFTHRKKLFKTSHILVIVYFDILFVGNIRSLLPHTTEFNMGWGIVILSHIVVGVVIYYLSREFFNRIFGGSRSKIILISFLILLSYQIVFIEMNRLTETTYNVDESLHPAITDEIKNDSKYDGFSEEQIGEILFFEKLCVETGDFCDHYQELLE